MSDIKTAVKVNFNDPDEFLAEVRKDHDRIDRGILRITVRRRYAPPFVHVSVVASAVIGTTVVSLDHRIGETFVGDEQGAIQRKIQTALDRLGEEAGKLGLEVRTGVFE